jgi:hypothetical protein
MTQFDHKKASELIGSLYGKSPYSIVSAVSDTNIFITQDSGTMAELAWENYVSVEPDDVCVVTHVMNARGLDEMVFYKDHPSIAEATRVAIAKALIKKGE